MPKRSSRSSQAELVVKLRPSDSHRWLRCKASPGFLAVHAAELPEQTFEYTVEGSRAHDYAASILLGRKWTGAKIDPDMKEYVNDYVEFVNRKKKELGPTAKILIEQKMPLFYKPDSNGMVDVAIHSKDSLHVIDLKYGEGVSVEAKGNSQLAIYLKNAANRFKVDIAELQKFSLTIFQPRARDNRIVRRWEPSPQDLDVLLFEIDETSASILADPLNQPFHPDEDVCQFCKAQAICPHYAGMLLGQVPGEVEQALELVEAGEPVISALEFPPAHSLSIETASKVFRVKRQLVAWLEKVEDYVLALHAQGTPVPGTKVVDGRGGNRFWKDEKTVRKTLAKVFPTAKFIKTELVSPSAVEKLMAPLIKKNKLRPAFVQKIESLVGKPPGKPTLVDETDPREAVDLSLAEFSDLTKTENEEDV